MTPARPTVTLLFRLLFLPTLLPIAGCISSGPAEPAAEPAGGQESLKTELLKAGAMLQPRLPVEQITVYLVGFHPMIAMARPGMCGIPRTAVTMTRYQLASPNWRGRSTASAKPGKDWSRTATSVWV